jgi:AcrR family transcriptional regulator
VTTTTTRPYLRSEERRRQLLDAAARLFVRDGYAGLTMVAVAAEAGVSRRLVYDHFPDLPALYDAFFTDRTARYLDGIDAAVSTAGGDRRAAFASAFERLLAITPEDRRAIQLVLTDVGRPELEEVRSRVRAHMERRWLTGSARGRRSARARFWMLVSGLFTLADLVDRDEIAAATARTIAEDVVGSFLALADQEAR